MKHTTILALILLISLLIFSCAEKQESDEVPLVMVKLLDFWNTGNFEGIEDVLHPEFEMRTTPDYESSKGIEAFMETVTNCRIAYPDFHIEVHEVFIKGDKAAARWTITGTNTGPGKHPPTGKKLVVPGLSILHLKDGKVLDEWIANNNISWLTQLGYQIVPPSTEKVSEQQ